MPDPRSPSAAKERELDRFTARFLRLRERLAIKIAPWAIAEHIQEIHHGR